MVPSQSQSHVGFVYYYDYLGTFGEYPGQVAMTPSSLLLLSQELCVAVGHKCLESMDIMVESLIFRTVLTVYLPRCIPFRMSFQTTVYGRCYTAAKTMVWALIDFSITSLGIEVQPSCYSAVTRGIHMQWHLTQNGGMQDSFKFHSNMSFCILEFCDLILSTSSYMNKYIRMF